MAEQPPSLGKIMQPVTEKQSNCFIEYGNVTTRTLLLDIVSTVNTHVVTKEYLAKLKPSPLTSEH